MKTIDVKSMLIGFLLCAVGFLTIGATSYSQAQAQAAQQRATRPVGMYQSSSVFIRDSYDPRTEGYVLTTVINTLTGKVAVRYKYDESTYK